ncbi:MAG: hypothetical protein K2N88_03690, partial [Muribaculaceae bacterium]|nr:hypothetical protein [Muribaculaceae bacterium]
ALAAAAMMALAANAQNGAPLYATGAAPAFNPSWAPEAAVEFDYADGVYTLELENLSQFKISTAMGSWDDFNGGALTVEGGAKLEDGVAATLVAGDANIEAAGIGNYTVTVSGDLKSITIKAEGEIDTSFPDVYLRGDVNGWLNDGLEDAWKFKVIVEEKVFSLEVPETLLAGDTFKFADAFWNAVNVGGDDSPIDLDVETELFKGGSNLTVAEDFDGTIYLNLDFEGAIFAVFATSDENKPDWAESDGVAGVTVEENVPAVYYNLQGVRVNAPEAGLYIVVKAGKSEKVLVK